MRSRRTYYYICQRCGDVLDPGEQCECLIKAREKEAKRVATDLQINKMYASETQQLTLQCCS